MTEEAPDGDGSDGGQTSSEGHDGAQTDDFTELPPEAVEEAERLTHLARGAVDDDEAAAYRTRRSELLAEYGFTARVRDEDDGGETLVCHPVEWLDSDGVVDISAIQDTDRAAEVPLTGRGEQGSWADAEKYNRAIVETVREEAGSVHAENARAFADFMGNHYALPFDDARPVHVREFLDEYYPRNAWPSDEAEAELEASLRLVFEKTESRYPLD
jgi:hypothetical protein